MVFNNGTKWKVLVIIEEDELLFIVRYCPTFCWREQRRRWVQA